MRRIPRRDVAVAEAKRSTISRLLPRKRTTDGRSHRGPTALHWLKSARRFTCARPSGRRRFSRVARVAAGRAGRRWPLRHPRERRNSSRLARRFLFPTYSSRDVAKCGKSNGRCHVSAAPVMRPSPCGRRRTGSVEPQPPVRPPVRRVPSLRAADLVAVVGQDHSDDGSPGYTRDDHNSNRTIASCRHIVYDGETRLSSVSLDITGF